MLRLVGLDISKAIVLQLPSNSFQTDTNTSNQTKFSSPNTIYYCDKGTIIILLDKNIDNEIIIIIRILSKAYNRRYNN